MIFQPPHNIIAKKRDPVVLEWRAKLAELRVASTNYQEAIIRQSYEEPNRIFPESFGDLHQWAKIDESSILKSKQDWLDLENCVKVNYRTYDQIINDGINLDTFASKSVSLVEINVVGSDDLNYKIQLLLDGLIQINESTVKQ